MKVEGKTNWCEGCEKNCCDHFVLENWPEWKISSLVEKHPFLRIFEHWVGEDTLGEEVDVWIMECGRLKPDGSCEDYPDDRPYFCSWAGEKYPPFSGCGLYKWKMENSLDRCD